MKINYRYEDKCLPKQALSANFQLRLNYKDLNYEKYLLESKNNMLCSSQQLPSEYRKDFLNQKNYQKMIKNKKILIIGGYGFIGKNLYGRLKKTNKVLRFLKTNKNTKK